MTDNNHVHKQPLPSLALAAIGVVFGDIGTSPLYALKEAFSPSHGIPLTEQSILGVISLLFWAIVIVVGIKYVLFVMRADNNGEGGVLALMALALRSLDEKSKMAGLLMMLGIIGACMFYGDAVITPAISVISAVEGLEIAAPHLSHLVLPLTIVILVLLFWIQRHGTAMVGRLFGPIMVLWFVVLAALGLWHIVQSPNVIRALNPYYAYTFMAAHVLQAYVVLGSVVLVLTGAEALYADMGHFGRRPIQLAWLGLVLPALTLNYMGQAALLLRDPKALDNPFFHLFPQAWLIPVVILATMATVIASQAVISGAFSMTRQAIQLGLLPRMQVVFTSEHEAGQIYLPKVNWTLLAAVMAAAIGFGSSAAMASAYGIAVTVTMLIDTVLTYFVVRYGWGFPLWIALGATGFFALIDGLLVAACSLKFLHGGWFPLLLALAMFAIMSTWKRGRELLLESIRRDDPDLIPFITALAEDDIPRTPRTAVFTVANVGTVPQALLHNLKHNQVLHETNVILTVKFHEVPWIPFADRVQVEPLARGFWRVTVNYGFKNTPDIPQALTLCRSHGLDVDEFTTSYFLSREVVVPTRGDGMAHWRERLFAAMTRNAGSVVEFFRLPNNSVIELGTRVQI